MLLLILLHYEPADGSGHASAALRLCQHELQLSYPAHKAPSLAHVFAMHIPQWMHNWAVLLASVSMTVYKLLSIDPAAKCVANANAR